MMTVNIGRCVALFIRSFGHVIKILKMMDVNTIWLTPIYPSPWKDYGYDMSSFCDIDPGFGTLNDFVPNHTFNEHPWFQATPRNDPSYVDYYV